ncbi:MAG: xanthine dehydrogenase family protein molybdopterin-binding subunit, partial [Sphingobium sp.]
MRVRQIGAGSSSKGPQRYGGHGSRRAFLIGAAATGGLALGWALWPRSYQPHLNLAPGEQDIGAFLKIDRAGQIIVIVPQAEMG